MLSLKRWLIFCAVLASGSTLGQGENNVHIPVIHGVLENYFWSYQRPGDFYSEQRARWLSGYADLTPSLRLVAGHFTIGSRDMLDENHLEYRAGGTRFRVGRIRTPFGHNSWDDLWYAGFVRSPMMYFMPLGYSARLGRIDSGFDIGGGSPSLQYSLAGIDINTGSGQLLPKHIDHVLARLQTFHRNVIVGINGMQQISADTRGKNRLVLADVRWTIPQLIFSGEYFSGSLHNEPASGFHADVAWHPVQAPRTTFLARLEQDRFNDDWPMDRLWTLGLKQTVSPQLTVEISYSASGGGNVANAARGWGLQVITFTPF